MTNPINVKFLRDLRYGGPSDQLATIADDLAAFVSAATTSIEVAIYDFRLADPGIIETVVGAFTAAADRGVAVRIAYDAGKPADGTGADFAALGADPAPVGTGDFLNQHLGSTAVSLKPIRAGGQLMHSKYILRDAAGTASTAVWTGSTNFTEDAWTRQENNVITVADRAMAESYLVDFEQMWQTGGIHNAGLHGGGSTTIDGVNVGWDFCPGDGRAVNDALAARVAAARERLIVATMVLSSHEVLASLAAAVAAGVALSGIYDGAQMDPIVRQWRNSPRLGQVLADWERVVTHLVRKESTPYTPTSVHDFMHLKVLISDGILTTGSYNFSGNAERNAENQLHVDDPLTLEAYTAYLDAVIAEYR
ncbi:phosphatidylserine/phosphatidylglycerophosphate/cardiolipin synthase-like enzyme [Jatrophihabitans sp. GAS493]|uniref:phospholipase D-like domain-containing protein n=1 Tax=Jatrophihabitans sp. GAS493 TaxID=1907575 RepID=UPI000BC080B2|nr:phospholipase D-like domain-containing protein [Jatrophihabitans sp. GAS493]SOD73654.1 phosphatidylserine/phosphatidylglycerophosphate/cardiolipin synthase-like enzyme [Jatrophihabitans sp. GAS493]